MNYSIMFLSPTGNTEILANTVLNTLPLKKCVYFGGFNAEQAEKSDLIFVGFWTDKGTCNEETAEFLKNLKNKKIALFGTAGYGGAEYFDSIISRIKENIPSENEFIGSYMCKGKLTEETKERYIKELADGSKDKEHIELMLNNYEDALSHPDIKDLVNIRDFARNMYYFV